MEGDRPELLQQTGQFISLFSQDHSLAPKAHETQGAESACDQTCSDTPTLSNSSQST